MMGHARILERAAQARRSMGCTWHGHREKFVGMDRRGNNVTTVRTCSRCYHDRQRSFIMAAPTEMPNNLVSLERVG